jgi:hypothetical protein
VPLHAKTNIAIVTRKHHQRGFQHTAARTEDPFALEHVLHLALLKQSVFAWATGVLYADHNNGKPLAIEQWHDLTTSFSSSTFVPLHAEG